MKAELLTTDPQAIAAFSTEELREQLSKGLTLVAENLFRTGLIWVELERRGENLAALRRGLYVYLPLIGSGRVDARAVVRFAGMPTLLRAISLLPVDEQVRLAKGGEVPLLMPDGTIKSLEPLRLTVSQVALVFAQGRIRPVLEQQELVDRRVDRALSKSLLRYDKRRQCFLIDRKPVPLAQIIGAMAKAEPVKGRPRATKTVKVEVALPESVLLSLQGGAERDLSGALLAAMRLAGMIA